MVSRKPHTVLFRRKREQRTDYHKRIKLLLSRKPRLALRFTNKRIITQIIEFHPKGDTIAVAANSQELAPLGWQFSLNNFPATYLTGILIAKKALKKGVKEAIFDTGLHSPLPHSKSYAFLKGAVDGGLKIPHQADVFPTPERINGKHIQDYAAHAGKKNALQFAQYLKRKVPVESIATQVEAVKKKIIAL